MCEWMFMAVRSELSQTGNHSNAQQWQNKSVKVCGIFKQWDSIQQWKEPTIGAMAWVSFKNVTRKRSQTRKSKYFMIPFK